MHNTYDAKVAALAQPTERFMELTTASKAIGNTRVALDSALNSINLVRRKLESKLSSPFPKASGHAELVADISALATLSEMLAYKCARLAVELDADKDQQKED